jgi:WD40 repeat protein
MAHPGGALTLDWKGSVLDLSSFAGDSGISDERSGDTRRSQAEDSWGWLASAGMDGTVKIWDMSASNHTLRQVHTLNVARPVQFVRWHSSAERPCDVVVTPLPAVSVPGQAEENWQPDIEIWDVRREYLAKETIWTGGAIVCKCQRLTIRREKLT